MREHPSDAESVLAAIKDVAAELGHTPTQREFQAHTGTPESQVQKFFAGWREAVSRAGLEPNNQNVRIDDAVLLRNWGTLVRELGRVPTLWDYRRRWGDSQKAFSRRYGNWSKVPAAFLTFADNNPEWADVLDLLQSSRQPHRTSLPESGRDAAHRATTLPSSPANHGRKIDGSPTYGNPLDFRGLRHEPVNEQGVVFLFGMVARELGYLVEAVQQGFPDCEAKRQVGPGKWQRVRIEFEYESRNFRDHGHAIDGCDVIVCWRHNWPDMPSQLEVVELSDRINTLANRKE
jgi:hypothetical protein